MLIAMRIALTGATIYTSPFEEPIRGGAVVVEGEKIVSAAGGAASADQTLDCSGLTVTAGFWNSHVHFFERKWADAAAIPADELALQVEQMLTRFGFTTVFDLASGLENTRAIRERIDSLRIYTTGEGLVAPGALPPDIVFTMMGVMRVPMPEVADAAQAAAATRALLERGVDGIKLFTSAPEVMAAAADEAHRAGKPVFVHPANGDAVRAALQAGVDVIAHTTPSSGPWPESMPIKHAALTPTLTLWKNAKRHDRLSAQDQFVETALGQLRAWRAAGGTVLFGTDLLASLTTAPAAHFGATNSGRIASGLDADLVAFEGEWPAAVRYTMRAGKIVYARV
jgi:imidazolonepropionase-like amidohydrolase